MKSGTPINQRPQKPGNAIAEAALTLRMQFIKQLHSRFV